MARIFLNGKFVESSKACISVTDHGFLYGDGVYETIRVTRGRPVLLEAHLNRLFNSAKATRLRVPLSNLDLKKAITRLIQTNRNREASIRLTLTRGPGRYGFDPRMCRRPTLAIVSNSFKGYPPSFYRAGVKVAIVQVRRNHPQCLPPSVKSTSCLNGILAKIESIDLGAAEGILLTLDGRVAEGTVSNVFIVKNGKIFTPSLGGNFLPGVTREYVCQMARNLGLSLFEADLRFNDLRAADEIFLTSSLMNIMPVTRLVWMEGNRRKEVRVGKSVRDKGKPGGITRSLILCFEKSLAFTS